MRAMILAAGRGERMRPLTDTIPKPLLKAGDKPLIVWHIERLVLAGITQLVINHAWLGHIIEDTLGDGRQFGAHISYSAESEALETAGGIATALDLLDDEPFLVINGDIWCDWDPSKAKEIGLRLEQERKLAWLLLTHNPEHHPRGDFILDASMHVKDRPAGSSDQAALTFTGIGVYQAEMFISLKKNSKIPLAPLLRSAMSKNSITGCLHEGIWVDVGTPERLRALDASLTG